MRALSSGKWCRCILPLSLFALIKTRSEWIIIYSFLFFTFTIQVYRPLTFSWPCSNVHTLATMLTDEEIKKVLLYCEFSVRKRKRTLKEQPTYALVFRRNALRVIKD